MPIGAGTATVIGAGLDFLGGLFGGGDGKENRKLQLLLLQKQHEFTKVQSALNRELQREQLTQQQGQFDIRAGERAGVRGNITQELARLLGQREQVVLTPQEQQRVFQQERGQIRSNVLDLTSKFARRFDLSQPDIFGALAGTETSLLSQARLGLGAEGRQELRQQRSFVDELRSRLLAQQPV